MRCPYCQSTETKVNDKRDTEGASRRRRECLQCSKRFTTYERAEIDALLVQKKDGRKELFDQQKLQHGILKACGKRELTIDSEEIVELIMQELREMKKEVISSTTIGQLVMQRLKAIDGIAYLRYASVHKAFTDLDSFEKELKVMTKR